jgi:hypothetical protein
VDTAPEQVPDPAPAAPAAPSHVGEGVADEANSDAVRATVDEPVVGDDDVPAVPVDTAPEEAPAVETVEEPVAPPASEDSPPDLPPGEDEG